MRRQILRFFLSLAFHEEPIELIKFDPFSIKVTFNFIERLSADSWNKAL